MRKKLLLVLSIILVNAGVNVSANGLNLKCDTGWFSSSKISDHGAHFYLDGVKYPEITEKINSSGWLWQTIRVVDRNNNKLSLLQATKNVKTGYTSKVEFFIINLSDFTFSKGIDKNKTRKRLAEWMADWSRGASGNCKKI